MKHLIALIILILATQSFANEYVVEGKLHQYPNRDDILLGTIRTQDRILKIRDTDIELPKCLNGSFVVAQDGVSGKSIRLVRVEKCQTPKIEEKKEETSFACPEIYRPVCGQAHGESGQRTFANHCHLKMAQANLLHEGLCL